MTIDSLVALLPQLNCKAKEAQRIGKEHGLSRHDVQALRHILDYSDDYNGDKLTEEQKDSIAKEYMEGGIAINKLAKKYKVGYNSVYCLLKSRNVDTQNPRLWSHIKTMRLVDCLKKGMSQRSIATLLGKSKTSIERKISRMRRDGEIA